MRTIERFSRRVGAGLMGLAATMLVAAAFPARAQWVVFDPANFTQSVINAYHTLQSNINQATQIANQINAINNQVRMLENQGLNLAAMPESLVNSYRSNMQNLMDSVQNIQGLEHSLGNMRDQYQSMYPSSYASNQAWQNLNGYVQKWNQADRANMQDALQTGSSVLNNLPATQADIARLGEDSAKATGALSAMQAGNQLSMNIAGQLAGLNAQTATYQQAMLQHMSADASGEAASDAAANAAWSDFGKTKPKPSTPMSTDNLNSIAPWDH